VPTPRRILRLQRVILETVATAVMHELHDPRLGFVTITRVKLAPDLTESIVYWSCLGTDAERRTSERALSDATGFLQSTVARALGTRTTPVLTFRHDATLTQAAHLEEIFEKLKTEPHPAPSSEADPAAPPSSGDAAPTASDATAPAEDAPPRPWKRKKPRRPRP
jgi:ribosome-binding factor A